MEFENTKQVEEESKSQRIDPQEEPSQRSMLFRSIKSDESEINARSHEKSNQAESSEQDLFQDVKEKDKNEQTVEQKAMITQQNSLAIKRQLTLKYHLLPERFKRRQINYNLSQVLPKWVVEGNLVPISFQGKNFYQDKKSLYIFKADWRFRQVIFWLIQLNIFNIFIYLTVIANSIMLALHSYEFRIQADAAKNTETESILRKIFLSIYIIEFLLKIIALGFVMKMNSYLRNSWNILDFICLLTAIMEETSFNTDTFLFLRVFRVLKPIRSMRIIPELQQLVGGLLASLPGLFNIYALLLFVMSFFAIFGVNMFGGYAHRACRTTREIIYIDETPSWPRADINQLCNSDQTCESLEAGTFCGSFWDYSLDPNTYDGVAQNELIFFGIIGFDDFGQALLTVFQVCTLEGWVSLMWNYHDASDYPFQALLFFPLIVIFGSFFVLNLILAQIIETYEEEQQKLRKRKKLENPEKEYQNAFAQALTKKQKEPEESGSISEPFQSNKSSSISSSSQFESTPLHNDDSSVESCQMILGKNRRRQFVEPIVQPQSYEEEFDQEHKETKNENRETLFPPIITTQERNQTRNQLKTFQILSKTNLSAGVLDDTSHDIAIMMGQDNQQEEGQKQYHFDEDNKHLSRYHDQAKSEERIVFENKQDQNDKDAPLPMSFDQPVQLQLQHLLPLKNIKLSRVMAGKKLQSDSDPLKIGYEVNKKTDEIQSAGQDSSNCQTEVIQFYQPTINKAILQQQSSDTSESQHSQKMPENTSLILEPLPDSDDQQHSKIHLQSYKSEEVLDDILVENASCDSQKVYSRGQDDQRYSQQKIVSNGAKESLPDAENPQSKPVSYQEDSQLEFSREPDKIQLQSDIDSQRIIFDNGQTIQAIQQDYEPSSSDDSAFSSNIDKKLDKQGSEKDSAGEKQEQEIKLYFVVKFCTYVVCSPLFNISIMVLILINTYMMASYSYEESTDTTELRHNLNYFFVTVFMIELVIKLIGLGPRKYIKDRYNIFDAVITVLSLIEIFLSWQISEEYTDLMGILLGLRTFRLLKLVRYNQQMREVLDLMMTSVIRIGTFSWLMCMFIFVWGLLGMELFAYRAILDEQGNFINSDDVAQMIHDGEISEIDYPRQNFNNMGSSLLSVFILINGEDWNSLMNQLVNVFAMSLSNKKPWIPITYCIIGIVIGNLTLLALFTGILLQGFIDQAQDKEKTSVIDQEEADHNEFWQSLHTAKNNQSKFSLTYFTKAAKLIYNNFGISHDEKKKRKSLLKLQKEMENSRRKTIDNIRKNTNQDRKATIQSTLLHYNEVFNDSIESKSQIDQMFIRTQIPVSGKSFGLFSATNRFRQLCSLVCQHRVFNIIITVLIVISSIQLTFESPLADPESHLMRVFHNIEYLFALVFLLEALIKIIAFGLILNGQKSYLRSAENVLDFLIVIGSIVEFALHGSTSITGLRTFRMIRILRPLRIIARSQSLHNALSSLLNSMPNIMRLQLIVMLFIFVMAIYQTNLFSGKFHRCYTEHLELSKNQSKSMITTKWDCLNYGGEWLKPDLNFDSIGESFQTLTTTASTEGWIQVLWDSVDSNGIDLEPLKDKSIVVGSICTLFNLFITSMLFMNLFIGVVVETFNRQKILNSNNLVLRPAQQNYLRVILQTLGSKPKKRPDISLMRGLRRLCFRIWEHKKFKIFMMFATLVNTIVLGCYYFMIPTDQLKTINRINLTFSVLFTFEAIIKIIALRSEYFDNHWNTFDFTILVLTYSLIMAQNLTDDSKLSAWLRVIRVCQVLRMIKSLKLIVHTKKFDFLKKTLADTIPVLSSFGLILFLLLYMFSVIAVQLFALLDLGSAPGLDREMDNHTNFQSFISSFLTLFRCQTGEAWNSIMFEAAWQRSITYQCNPDESYESIIEDGRDPQDWQGPKGCGNRLLSFMFFGIFQLLVSQIYLNLVIAIIVDAFTSVIAAGKLPVTEDLIDEFVRCWAKYDPDATSFISIENLNNLLEDLCKSNQCNDLFVFKDVVANSQKFRDRLIFSLEIPTFGNFRKVMFYDTLQKLSYRAFKIQHNKNVLKENFLKLKIAALLQGKRHAGSILHIQAVEQDNINKDFYIDFDEATLEKLKKNNKRIELIHHLSQKVDTTRNINDAQLQPKMYTTKHYKAACTILEYWQDYKAHKITQDQPPHQILPSS